METPPKPIIPRPAVDSIPSWWHHHGSKINFFSIADFDGKYEKITFGSNTARVDIYPDREEKCKRLGWIVEYRIQHTAEGFTVGTIWMSLQDLKTAFGLSDHCDAEWGQHVLDRFGGDVAYQGKYIRSGNYLNLPGPGHAYDGDPNMSIETDEEFRKALLRFLNHHNH